MARIGTLVAVLMALLAASQARAETLRVGLGYLQDVQFAPFYTADKAGLYKKQGLEVTFQHGFPTELYPLLAQGKLDFVVADAEDAIIYRVRDPQAAPFKYVLAVYQEVPTALFSLAAKNIKTLRDLKGKTIGMPAPTGVSYTSLQAMLRAAGLKESDVKIQQIGFTQLEAVLSGRVDVAMGFVNNEPVVLSGGAKPVAINVIRAGPYTSSAGNGIITTDRVLEKADVAKRFLRATQEALALTVTNPRAAFEYSKAYVPNLNEERFRVLQASLPLYQSAYSRKNGLGFSNPAGWDRTLRLLKEVGRVKTDLPATSFYTNAFLQPGLQPSKR